MIVPDNFLDTLIKIRSFCNKASEESGVNIKKSQIVFYVSLPVAEHVFRIDTPGFIDEMKYLLQCVEVKIKPLSESASDTIFSQDTFGFPLIPLNKEQKANMGVSFEGYDDSKKCNRCYRYFFEEQELCNRCENHLHGIYEERKYF